MVARICVVGITDFALKIEVEGGKKPCKFNDTSGTYSSNTEQEGS
jgi:hypothetical protein